MKPLLERDSERHLGMPLRPHAAPETLRNPRITGSPAAPATRRSAWTSSRTPATKRWTPCRLTAASVPAAHRIGYVRNYAADEIAVDNLGTRLIFGLLTVSAGVLLATAFVDLQALWLKWTSVAGFWP